ncbi:MAG: histidine kinase [Hyphomonadaceae bacterium]|nr:histidine kinase [Hyphomonadaceae bacterium]
MRQSPAPKAPRVLLLAERHRSFAIFQICFWTAVFAMRTIAAIQVKPEYAWSFMPSRAAIAGAGAVATTAIHLALSRFEGWSMLRRLALGLALSLVAIEPMRRIESYFTAMAGVDVSRSTFTEYVLQFGWLIFMWAGYYFAQEYAFRVRRQAQELAEVQSAALNAHVRMLRYQLNPHFLFNTLNAISTLVLDGRNVDAEQMILRLSRFLRHAIDIDPEQLAPLGEELQVQKLYLEIEQARFGDRLQLIWEVPESLENALVPSLILQPLVENAVKHAIAPAPRGGTIALRGSNSGGRLRLCVDDSGPGIAKDTSAGVHIGLRNTRERLEAAFGGAASIAFARSPEGGLSVVLDMPLQVPSGEQASVDQTAGRAPPDPVTPVQPPSRGPPPVSSTPT